MVDFLGIIKKYYDEKSELYRILVDHSIAVTQKALEIANNNPHESFDVLFVEEAAMMHDIGIFKTDAPGIQCFGDKPYICHGYLGSELLHSEGLPKHALVCERHTGAGIPLTEILIQCLPLPHRDMCPVSKEEQLVCFADKFFSKSKIGQELPVDKIRKSLARYGEESVKRFDSWFEKWG